MSDQFAQQDPTAQHAAPGSGDQTVEYPGRTADMDVRPDHGEETYRGSGRLQGKKAVITGGDSGIGRAVAIAFAREGADVLLTHLDAEKDDADGDRALGARGGPHGRDGGGGPDRAAAAAGTSSSGRCASSAGSTCW